MGKYSLHVLERKHFVVFFCILVGVGWLSLVMYTLSISRHANGVTTPEEIATQSVNTPKPSSSPAMIPERKGISAQVVADKGITMPTSSPILPQVMMTSTSMHVRETSNATAQVVGSGVSYEAATENGSSSRNKGISYNGLGYGGNMLAMSSAIVLSQPGAGYANDLAETVSASDKHGMKHTDGPPHGPFPDPVGDVTWGLMAILTIGYGVIVRRRKQQACK